MDDLVGQAASQSRSELAKKSYKRACIFRVCTYIFMQLCHRMYYGYVHTIPPSLIKYNNRSIGIEYM